jgi:hypothetical protein
MKDPRLIRAPAGNADTADLVVIGSQAILGSYPDGSEEPLRCCGVVETAGFFCFRSRTQ